MSHPRLVPDWFTVPERVETEEFVISPLTWTGFPRDFECCQSSVAHLQETFNVDDPVMIGNERWPAGSTLESAFLDAAYNEMERFFRSSFAYVVLDLEESRQLGCIYIFPCKKDSFDIECRMWVRADEHERGFDGRLYEWFRNWVAQDWPFSGLRVVWPGRETSWEEWEELAETSPYGWTGDPSNPVS